jgi:hypothetical protein
MVDHRRIRKPDKRYVPVADRPRQSGVICTECGVSFIAFVERNHDVCTRCIDKERRDQGRELELELWQVEMYLDAMVRQESAMPWDKRKIR